MNKINKMVFGWLHKLSSATFRRFGFDNYAWSVALFVAAAVASFFVYRLAMSLAVMETNPNIAGMRQRSAFGGIMIFVVLAGFVLHQRKFFSH
mgnify:FL=1